MVTEPSQSTVSKTPVILWSIILFILPLLFFPSLQDQDLEVKLFAITIISSAILGLSLFRKEVYFLNRNSKNIFILILIFLISVLLSAGKIINTAEGISAFVYLLIPFVFLYSIIISRKLNISLVIKLACFTVLILTLITLIEFALKSFSASRIVIDYSIRGTMSNKNFISETMVMLLPFSVSGIIIFSNGEKKLAVASLIAGLSIIILLQTISCWLAVFITGLIFIPLLKILFSRNKKQFQKTEKLRVIIFLVIIISVLFSVKRSAFFEPLKTKIILSERYLTSDVNELISKDDESNVNSVFQRLLLWRNTLMLAKENIVTGNGLSNWRVEWAKFGVGGAHYLSAGIMHFEHPHNEFLLFLSETGIIGLVAFILLFAGIIVTGFRQLKNLKEEKRIITFVFTASVFSFLILCFFGYPFHRPFTIIILMIIIAVIISGEEEVLKLKSKYVNPVAVIVLLISLFSVTVVAQRLSADYHISKALTEQNHGRFPRMIKEVNAAQNEYAVLDNSGTPFNWYKGFAHFYSGSDSSLFYFLKAEKENPNHLQVLSDIGASLENKGRHKEAIIYLRRAISITPRYEEANLNLAIAYFNSNKIKESLVVVNSIPSKNSRTQNVLFTILQSYVKNIRDTLQNDSERNCFDKNYSDKKVLDSLNEKSKSEHSPLENILIAGCK